MRSLAAFLLVNGVLAAGSAIAAAVVWAAGNALLVFFPEQADNAWAWYGIGAVALVLGTGFIIVAAQQGARL